MLENKLTVYYEENPCYNIIFENSYKGLLKYLKEFNIKEKNLCIVTESTVSEYYLQTVELMLAPYCKKLTHFIFKAGEESKNLSIVSELYEYLILEHFNRQDMLIALGGGVVGDLTGFTAATYLRGIDFIQLPTTLLSQVDSSIGGKTGVDFSAYKNMVGAFHQPKLVYINISTLKTLTDSQFHSGLGEVIKHGLIKDKEYYNWIERNKEAIDKRDIEILQKMIFRSCEIKREVVQNDPKEKGERALLNFGHTLGHAIEKLMNFSLLHGECVGIGCILSSIISYNRKSINKQELDSIIELFHYFNFPYMPQLKILDIISTTKLDKKMDSDYIRFILLESIGKAVIDKTVTDEEMSNAIQLSKEYKW